MEDVKQKQKQKQGVSEKNEVNPGRFSANFLYKAAIVVVFLVIIPLFPSQAPDFINQTLLTRSWELLHLVFVGIAVSYGLFSRRNEEAEKEKDTHHSKFDNAQSYVSRFLQVSSVFEDEAEAETETETADKVQTWSSQYLRNEPPTVVVAQELTSPRPREKPLLLPVRSLKSRVPDPDSPEIGSRGGSGFGSKRVSSGSRNWELKGSDRPESEGNLNRNLVLPSPIPWRSRSGRLETTEEAAERERRNSPSPSPRPLYNRISPVEEPELNQLDQSRPARPQMPRSPRPNSEESELNQLDQSRPARPQMPRSPRPNSESQAKSVEDLMRKRSFRRSPPPPPPPPPVVPKSQSFKSSTTRLRSHVDDERDLQRSYSYSGASMDSNSSRSRTNINSRTQVDVKGKSVRTSRAAREDEHDNNLNKKSVQFDQSCFMTKPSIPEKRQYIDEVIEESDDDSEDDNDDDVVEEKNKFKVEEEEEEASSDSDDEGPDVDKKADEFIAKFREQIRLQRIESIKKSSAQMNRNFRR